MSKRDWQLDWWSVISYDALDCPKPGTEKEWFEKWLQQRAALQYWLQRVRKLEAVVEASKILAKWMQWWLDENLCECNGIHICGRTQREQELNEFKKALAELEE